VKFAGKVTFSPSIVWRATPLAVSSRVAKTGTAVWGTAANVVIGNAARQISAVIAAMIILRFVDVDIVCFSPPTCFNVYIFGEVF
jgi:hypothetical protein